jgi:hypothetical protein
MTAVVMGRSNSSVGQAKKRRKHSGIGQPANKATWKNRNDMQTGGEEVEHIFNSTRAAQAVEGRCETEEMVANLN